MKFDKNLKECMHCQEVISGMEPNLRKLVEINKLDRSWYDVWRNSCERQAIKREREYKRAVGDPKFR